MAYLIAVDHVAFIGTVGVDAAEDVHQRGFARAVLAAQGVDLALGHLDIHVVQRLHAGEYFGDVLHFEDCIAQMTFLLKNPKRETDDESPVSRRQTKFRVR